MTDYDTANIRTFITEKFSSEELRTFCYDYFRDVYEQFAEGMSKPEMVQRLIESCDRRDARGHLLAALRKARTIQYDAWFGKPVVEAPSPQIPRRREPRQVFLSHAYEDSRFAHRLAADLEAQGWHSWIAPESIRPGEKWAEAIGRGLDESGVFVVALTPAAVNSKWVVTETNAAIELEHEGKAKFIPLDVESCDVPTVWSVYQSISFREDYAAGLAALVSALEGATAAPVEHVPAVERPPHADLTRPRGKSLIRRVPRWIWAVFAAVLLLLGVVVGRWVWGLVALQAPAGVTPEPAPIPMPLATPAISVATKDGMELVYVPAGKFLMGSTADDSYAVNNEKPPHLVDLDAFWIDRAEVTNAMFTQFVAVTGYKTRAERIGSSTVFNPPTTWKRTTGADWQHPRGPGSDLTGLEQHPVVHVTWDDADAYCQWAGRRLPTEAEWEKAARGTDGRLYPWGKPGPTGKLSNFGMNVGGTMPVGSYPDGMSPYGALDMAGNVWEWVADYYSEKYYQVSPLRNPQGPSSGIDRVMRGGSWYMDAGNIRAAYRGWDDQTNMNVHVGFRCARSP